MRCVLLKTPFKLTSIRICLGGSSLPFASNLSSQISSTSLIPALGTTTSTVPYFFTASSCKSSRSSHLVTSQCAYVAPLK